jgi:hypothetical protein
MKSERLYPLSEVCDHLPIRRSYKTMYDWTQQGVLGNNGERVMLEYRKVAGVRFTSVESYYRFIEEQNEVST